MFLPVTTHRRSLVSAHGADDLADSFLVVDVCPRGKGYPPVVFGDVFAPVQLPFYLVVSGQVLDDAHLGGFLRLNESVVVAPRHLRKGILSDNSQIIRIV